MNSISVFNFAIKNAGNKTIDVFVDGIIVDEQSRQIYADWFGDTTSVSYKSIRTEMANAVNDGCKTINVRVNCCGGNVVEAMALHDYFIELESKGITINRIGCGMVASAATYLVSGDNSEITDNSWYMIHNVSGSVYGSLNEIESYAATMRKFNDTIAEFYATNTGIEIETIKQMMNDETWLTGKQAVEMGFIAKRTPESTFTNEIDPSKWMFKNTSVVAVYNSFINKNTTNEMEKTTIQTIINGVSAAFMDTLKTAGIVKDDNQKMIEQITNALDTALAPMNTGIADMVNDAIDEKFKTIQNQIDSSVDAAIKNIEPSTAIDDKLKPINDEIEAIKNSLLDDAGSAGNNNRNDGKVDATNHSGIKFE